MHASTEDELSHISHLLRLFLLLHLFIPPKETLILSELEK